MKPATAADIARIGRISERRVEEILREAEARFPCSGAYVTTLYCQPPPSPFYGMKVEVPGVTIPDTEL